MRSCGEVGGQLDRLRSTNPLPGLTVAPAESAELPPRFRRSESSVVLRRHDWHEVCEELLSWSVKTRSGFAVEMPEGGSLPAGRLKITLLLGPLRVVEPVEVVAAMRSADRCVLAYGTLEGHPVSGEEAFILDRLPDGVRLTVRSVTGPGVGGWRFMFPLALLAQRFFRGRYLRSLAP
jgi:uncharacterized protein (UPF0548 family)